MRDGGLIWRFRLWLGLRIVPARALRMINRSIHALPDDARLAYYWSDARLAIDDRTDAIRREREIKAALLPTPGKEHGDD